VGGWLSQTEALEVGLELIETFLNARSFLGPKAMERLGHEIIANLKTGERAFDAFDNG
jgi:hypothetical protein